jgi:hypothetical protein
MDFNFYFEKHFDSFLFKLSEITKNNLYLFHIEFTTIFFSNFFFYWRIPFLRSNQFIFFRARNRVRMTNKMKKKQNEKHPHFDSVSRSVFVRTRGFEPPHPKAPPPQDGMSTSFTTCAFDSANIAIFLN